MANRVSVGINVNDNSRRALSELRRSMQRTSRDIRRSGGTVDFRVNVRPGTSRAELRRIQHSLRGMPVTINTRLDPPPVRTVRQRIARALSGFAATIRTRLAAPPGAARRALLRRLGQLFTVPVRLTFRGGRGVLRSIFRPLASFIGGILNDGIGQGILGAFRAAGPAGVAILAAAIITGISLIGAALAGALVFAFGAAFVGLAAYMVIQSGKVTKQWDGALKRLSEKFKGAAEPMIPVIEHAITLMEQLGNSFAPHFKQAMAEAAPFVQTFLDSFANGIKAFGKRAFAPMMEGFNTLLLAFGPEFENFMEGLGDAFGNLGRTVQQHSGEIAMALRMILGLITTIVDIVNFFARTWVTALRVITVAWGTFLGYLATIFEAITTGMGAILQAATWAFGWIPGLGGKLKSANESFKNFSDGTVGKLRELSRNSVNWGRDMDRANKRRTLQVDISNLQAKLKTARDDLTRTANKKAKAKVQANIDQLNRSLNAARDKLARLDGYTIQTYVDTWQRNRGYAGNSVTGARATGGNIGAAATGGVRRNMTLVGEHGPEVVDLPGGSHVRSNSDSRRMMAGGGGGAPTTLVIEAANDDVSRMLLKILRGAIRVQGGNVQVVLGKGSG